MSVLIVSFANRSKSCVWLYFLGILLSSQAVAFETQEFTKDGYWVVPEGVTTVMLSARGGGGGGGGGDSTYQGGNGGGGGAGALLKTQWFQVEPGTRYRILVGKGGIGGAGGRDSREPGVREPIPARGGGIGRSSMFGIPESVEFFSPLVDGKEPLLEYLRLPKYKGTIVVFRGEQGGSGAKAGNNPGGKGATPMFYGTKGGQGATTMKSPGSQGENSPHHDGGRTFTTPLGPGIYGGGGGGASALANGGDGAYGKSIAVPPKAMLCAGGGGGVGGGAGIGNGNFEHRHPHPVGGQGGDGGDGVIRIIW